MQGNGKKDRKETLQSIKAKLASAERLLSNSSVLRARSELMARLGKSFGTARDIYEALGYSKELLFEDFYARYKRQDIASVIIDRPVEESWEQTPEITEGTEEEETDFEIAWKDLQKQKKVFFYLSRVDKLCGIGKFAILLIGVNDGKKLDQPLTQATEVLYFQTYKECDIQIQQWEKNPNSERYGLPVLYSIRIANPDHNGEVSQLVHYTRVVHIADNCLDNDVFGSSRMENVFNRLQDLELAVGSGAEMFWQGAFKGLAFILDKDAQYDPNQGDDELEAEIENYVHKFQRHLKLQGMTVQELGGNSADPSSLVDTILNLIAGTKKIPKRILIGSERGELASSSDADNWLKQISSRQVNFCEPVILRPLIDMLIEAGILPEPVEEYEVKWPGRMAPTEEEKANLAQTKTNTLVTYANSIGADQIVPVEMFLEKMLGLEKDEIEEIQEILGRSFEDIRGEEAEEEEINKAREEESYNLQKQSLSENFL